MKHIVGLIFLVIVGLFFACEQSNEPRNPFTNLKVEVLDQQGNPKANAQVQLYANLVDLEMRNYPILIALTDEKGIAHFENIEPDTYLIYASYEQEDWYYDNESQGDIFLREPITKGQDNHFVTITDRKRPTRPSQVQIKEAWVMDYPTASTFLYKDTAHQLVDDLFLGILLENQYYQEAGPLVYMRSISKNGLSQKIAASQQMPEPNPSIALKNLQDHPLIYFIFKGGGLEKGTLQSSGTISLHITQASSTYPDRLRIVEDDHQIIDIKLVWE